MANNRMKLRCRVCGELFNIAKYYPSFGWFTTRDDNNSFNVWLEEHRHAHGREIPPGHPAGWEAGRRYGSTYGTECFELTYEEGL